MSNRIITISRQYGGGGHSVAEALSDRLGIPFYDQELINKLAVETGYSRALIKKEGEYMESGNFFMNALRTNRFETNKQDQIWDATKMIVRDLAKKEPCIIVGRCANYLLRKNEDVISVFLHADYVTCAERVKERKGSSELPSPGELRKVDRRRAAFYSYYTDYVWDDAKNYTITLDTGKVSIEKCAEIIADLYGQ